MLFRSIVDNTTSTNLLYEELKALNVSSLNPFYVIVDAYTGSTFTTNIKEAAKLFNQEIFKKARACRYVRGTKSDGTPVEGKIDQAGWEGRSTTEIQTRDQGILTNWSPLLTSRTMPIQWVNAPETQIDSAGKLSPLTTAGKALGLFKSKNRTDFIDRSDDKKLKIGRAHV